MFQGSIPQAIRNILSQIVKTWDCDDIHVGCSGNFTVERILAELDISHIYGCDVTIYSCAIGAYLAQQPFRLELREEFKDTLGWLEPYIGSDIDKIATLQLCTRLLEGLQKSGEWKVNAYYKRMNKAYFDNWDDLHKQTALKLEALPFSTSGFYAGDAAEYVKAIPPGHGFISYPPFWGGGYEAMWDKLDMVFKWDNPTYDIMGEAEISQYLEDITSCDFWAFGVPVILDDYKDNLVGLAHTTNRGVPIYMYASSAPSKIVLPHQTIAPCLVPRLGQSQDIGNSLHISPLEASQFNALRSQYMNPMIKPASPPAAFAVTVDGFLVGAYALSDSSGSFNKDQQTIYLLSDFAIVPSQYKRLSKLVLYAALSKEGRQLAERIARRRIRKIFTTAFTNNQSSMKYRGLFKVYSKKELDDQPYKYQINYVAPSGQWSLSEALNNWKRKHIQ